MAWTTPITWVAGNTLTAQQMNQQVRDNLNETAPAKATVEGRIFVTDGANSIVERIPDSAVVAGFEDTALTVYTDLLTVGPTVAVTTGTRAYVDVSCQVRNNTVDETSFMSYEVSGATSIAASDSHAFSVVHPVAGISDSASFGFLREGLTAGSNTFTAKYRVAGGIGTFGTRRITVIPF